MQQVFFCFLLAVGALATAIDPLAHLTQPRSVNLTKK